MQVLCRIRARRCARVTAERGYVGKAKSLLPCRPGLQRLYWYNLHGVISEVGERFKISMLTTLELDYGSRGSILPLVTLVRPPTSMEERMRSPVIQRRESVAVAGRCERSLSILLMFRI